MIFKNVKIYPDAEFYELAVSYKGVNYFQKFKVNELEKLNKIKFKVYEQGNLKNKVKIEKFDYIIEVDQINKALRVTEDLVITNDGDFTYSPIIPQTNPGIEIPIPENISKISPIFNISENNYKIYDKKILLKVFLKPGRNYFTFNYIIKPQSFPYLIRLKTLNTVKTTRVIIPDARNKIVSNLISNFSIRETEQGAIKIGVKKNIKKGSELKFKIMGKPNFKKGIISSSVSSFQEVKKIENFINFGAIII